jgi:hypothetical protein
MAGLAAGSICYRDYIAIAIIWFSTIPDIAIDYKAAMQGTILLGLKFSTLLWKQVRAFDALLIVKLGDWVPFLKT